MSELKTTQKSHADNDISLAWDEYEKCGEVGNHAENLLHAAEFYQTLSKAKDKENQRLTTIAAKHATLNDERYELLLKQKSDIEMMLDQLFKHEKVDAWLVCKMNDMLDDVNHQLEKSRTEAEQDNG